MVIVLYITLFKNKLEGEEGRFYQAERIYNNIKTLFVIYYT